MKVKARNRLLILFTFLPLVITVISLNYLPDLMPAHYGFNGKVTRWGSKYETLIMPLLSLLCCGISLTFTNYISRKKRNKNKIRNLNICNIMMIFTFNILTVSFLISDIGKIININNTFSGKLIYVCLGIGFMLLGSYLPKFRINNLFGIKTPKTFRKHDIWRKAHKLSGKIFIVFGAIFSIISLFIPGNISMYILVASLIIITIVVSIYPNK